MSSPTGFKQKAAAFSNKSILKTCKLLLLFGLFLYGLITFLSSHIFCQQSSKQFSNKWSMYANTDYSPTNISQIMFGIAGSSSTWANKRHYIESWWQPNQTRGFVFLDRAPIEHLPWPLSSPPYRVSEDTSKYKEYDRHLMPFAIRMVKVIEETFNADQKGVRWYVMADDDTVLFLHNLVDVLSKYDHREYFYIGSISEAVICNSQNSFEMAYGGAGYALSYPLAKAVANHLVLCIKRYPDLYGSDHILQACITDLGVSLTRENGFHQIDLRGDISGLLSAHPHTPFLSLHHLDAVKPIFPSMDRHQAVNHLMKAAKIDESRLLQQSVCYHKKKINWTFSVSWGYSAHIYEQILPPSTLIRPLETFIPWKNGAVPPLMLNPRRPTNASCETPHVFFFESVARSRGEHIVTTYVRKSPRGLPTCPSSGYHSAEHITKIYVLSPLGKHEKVGHRRECCDVLPHKGMNSIAVKLRNCMKDEIVA